MTVHPPSGPPDARPLPAEGLTVAEALARDDDPQVRLATGRHHRRFSEDVCWSLITGTLRDHAVATLADIPEEMLRDIAASADMRLLAALAARSDLPAATLAAVRDSGDDHVQYALIRNASLSPEHLGRLDLGEYWTRELLACRDDLPAETYEALAAYDRMPRILASKTHTPLSLLRRLAETGNCALELAKNPATPSDVLTTLVTARETRFCAAQVAEHPHAGHLVGRLADHRNSDVRAAVAARTDTPASVVADLSADRSPKVRSAAASNPHLPAAAKAKLLRSNSTGILVGLLANPTVSDNEYDSLLRRGNTGVAAAAAGLARTTRQQFDYLTSLAVSDVDRALAASDHTPVAALHAVADRSTPALLSCFADREHLPVAIARKLARSPWEHTRLALLRSASPPVGSLLLLARDAVRGVRLAAAEHPHMPAHVVAAWARLGDAAERCAAAANPSADSIGADTDLEVCDAQRPRLSLSDAETLQDVDDDPLASAAAAAADPRAPSCATVAHLFSAAHRLLTAAAGNPHTPPAELRDIGNRPGPHNTALRVAAAANPSTPEGTLKHLAKMYPDTRVAVAANPAATARILEELVGYLTRSTPTPGSDRSFVERACTSAARHPNIPEAPRRRVLTLPGPVGDAVRDMMLGDAAAPAQAIGIIAEQLEDTVLNVTMTSSAAETLAATLAHPQCPATLTAAVAAAAESHHATSLTLLDVLSAERAAQRRSATANLNENAPPAPGL